MNVVINLPPEVEASLEAQARAHGLALTAYVEQILSRQAPLADAGPLTPAERAAAWRESVRDLPDTPPLPDSAVRRDSIYRDRG